MKTYPSFRLKNLTDDLLDILYVLWYIHSDRLGTYNRLWKINWDMYQYVSYHKNTCAALTEPFFIWVTLYAIRVIYICKTIDNVVNTHKNIWINIISKQIFSKIFTMINCEILQQDVQNLLETFSRHSYKARDTETSIVSRN